MVTELAGGGFVKEVIVQKSGKLYLLWNRREAIAVDLDDGSMSGIIGTQAFLRSAT